MSEIGTERIYCGLDHHIDGASAYNRSFQCMEATNPHAIKNQRKVRNVTSRVLCLYGVREISTNQSSISGWISTNESAALRSAELFSSCKDRLCISLCLAWQKLPVQFDTNRDVLQRWSVHHTDSHCQDWVMRIISREMSVFIYVYVVFTFCRLLMRQLRRGYSLFIDVIPG